MSGEMRCAVCNRLTPTAEQWETVRGGERADLCWWGGACSGPRYDWRARALAAEALLGAAARGDLPRCDVPEDCGRLAVALVGDTAACDVCAPRWADYWRASRGTEPVVADLPHAAALRAAMGGGA